MVNMVKEIRTNKSNGFAKMMDVARASKLENNIANIITGIAQAIKKAIVGAILMQVIFTLVPDFAQRFPIIYGVYDGFLQFVEFLCKYACKFILETNINGMKEEWQQMMQELLNWTQTFL